MPYPAISQYIPCRAGESGEPEPCQRGCPNLQAGCRASCGSAPVNRASRSRANVGAIPNEGARSRQAGFTKRGCPASASGICFAMAASGGGWQAGLRCMGVGHGLVGGMKAGVGGCAISPVLSRVCQILRVISGYSGVGWFSCFL